MLELVVAAALCVATAKALRGGWALAQLPKLDSKVLFLAVISIVAAVLVFGPVFGVLIIIAVIIHELGHVMAYRVCGHDDARFRLIPLLGGVAISNRAPKTQTDDFFITLMGPAIGLAPMVLAFALSYVLSDVAPVVAVLLSAFGMTVAALNAFNLLPLYPLDGGRMIRLATSSLWPAAELFVAGGMVALLVLLAVVMKSLIIGLIALMGFQSIRAEAQRRRKPQPMKKATALLALAAHIFTLAAFILGALPIITAWGSSIRLL